MPLALSKLQKRLDIVVVEPRPLPHVRRLDADRAPRWLIVSSMKPRPQQVVERIPKRTTPALTFAFHPDQYILIQRNSRPDAHDASILASSASNGRLGVRKLSQGSHVWQRGTAGRCQRSTVENRSYRSRKNYASRE